VTEMACPGTVRELRKSGRSRESRERTQLLEAASRSPCAVQVGPRLPRPVGRSPRSGCRYWNRRLKRTGSNVRAVMVTVKLLIVELEVVGRAGKKAALGRVPCRGGDRRFAG